MPAAFPKIVVVIADPDENSRESIGRYLRGKGLDTVEVSDGGKALSEILIRHPDILLLDLSVGVLAPDRLVRILQTNPNTKAIPILYLSDKGRAITGFRPGIDEFLRKPVDEEEMFRRIQRALFPDSMREGRSFLRLGPLEPAPVKSEFLSSDDVARLHSLAGEEGGDSGNGSMGRIVFFLPDPSLMESIVIAIGQYQEFEADRTFFSHHREGEVHMGMFGKIRVGESKSLLLYAFPYLRSTSPLWYAMAPRPIGIIAFMKDEMSSSLEGLLAVSDYTRGAEAQGILAVMGKTFTNFGLGENTHLLFRNRVEQLGGTLKVQEMEQLSPGEIRDSMAHVVRQYLDGGKR